VDVVTCFDVFGQIPDPAAALRAFQRVLRPGGLLAVNAFTPEDSQYGLGEEVSPDTFNYKGTLFRYFPEEMLRDALADWTILTFTEERWTDPPHGAFRPYEHEHSNWLVLATPKG
jgi:ubiquinone/menaquinone biosynthesis C-methylase UbiE